MNKTIAILLILFVNLGALSSCGRKTVSLLSDNETMNSAVGNTNNAESKEYMGIQESNITNESNNMDTDDRIPDNDETEQHNGGAEIAFKPLDYEYAIKKVEDQYYMVLNTYEIAKTDEWEIVGMDPSIQFESIAEFSNKILNAKLDDYTIHYMLKYLNAVSQDNIGIPIHNVEHVFEPIFTDGWETDHRVEWNKTEYTFNAFGDSKESTTESATVTIVSKDRYEKILNDYQQYSLTSLLIDEKNEGLRRTVFYMSNSEKVLEHRYDIFISNGKYFATITVETFDELTLNEIRSFGVQEYKG